MQGEIVEAIYNPLKEHNWMVLKTDQHLYSLRLGGYRKEPAPILMSEFDEVPFPYAGWKISEVYSDDFWVYILLDNGGVISSGELFITGDGQTHLSVQFDLLDDFDTDFFKSNDFFKLKTGESGWSEKK